MGSGSVARGMPVTREHLLHSRAGPHFRPHPNGGNHYESVSTRPQAAVRSPAGRVVRCPPPMAPPRFRHPNESAKNRLVYRTFEAALREAAGSYARGRMIDVGGGRKPWAPVFAAHVTEHVCVDHVEKDDARGATVDVVATAYDIPLPDGDAQTVLMTEVLEHLERPADAVAECFRLLAPGGHLIATTPMFWP